MARGIVFVFTLLSVIAPSCQAIKQRELVKAIKSVLSRLPPMDIPDIDVTELNLFANVTNITATDLTLSDVALEIKSNYKLLLTLTGMTGVLDCHLLAGIAWPIPIKHDDQVEGTFADTTMAITFSINGGDAKMSHIAVNIGVLKIDFGDDKLAQQLSDTFEPILIFQLQTLLPGSIISHYADVFDLNGLNRMFLKALPNAALPDITFKEGGYDASVTNVKIDSASALGQTVTIKNKKELIFDISNLRADGDCNYKIGKVGDETIDGTAKIKILNAKLQVVSQIVHDSSELEIQYVSAFQTIEEFTLRTDSPNPTVQWFINAIQGSVQSMIEQSFVFLMNFILSL